MIILANLCEATRINRQMRRARHLWPTADALTRRVGYVMALPLTPAIEIAAEKHRRATSRAIDAFPSFAC